MALAAKEIDNPWTSSSKQTSTKPKKRIADYPGHHELMNSDPGVFTPRKPRTPAKFRLSVSLKKEPLFSLQEERIPESLLTERKRVITSDFSPDSVLPPPDFDEASYPQGWVVGKRRRLVNVDVVESMRRIAVYEMNRKDREITGLNEQLDEDAKTMEFLQLQLQQERSRRLHSERDNAMLHGRIATIMSMFGEEELEEGQIEEQEEEEEEDDQSDQASIFSEDEPPISDDQP